MCLLLCCCRPSADDAAAADAADAAAVDADPPRAHVAQVIGAGGGVVHGGVWLGMRISHRGGRRRGA